MIVPDYEELLWKIIKAMPDVKFWVHGMRLSIRGEVKDLSGESTNLRTNSLIQDTFKWLRLSWPEYSKDEFLRVIVPVMWGLECWIGFFTLITIYGGISLGRIFDAIITISFFWIGWTALLLPITYLISRYINRYYPKAEGLVNPKYIPCSLRID